MLPALGIPLAVIRYCQALDELQLRMQLESLAFGFTATAIVTFTYGFLQNAGLPDVSWIWVWPVMARLLDRRPAGGAVEVPLKNKLRELRSERNWSQADLAERADVSRQTINAIETGKYDPSLPLAFALARIFKLKIEDVFDDRG